MFSPTSGEAHRRLLAGVGSGSRERGVHAAAVHSPGGTTDFGQQIRSITELVGDQTQWNKEVIGVRRLIGEFSDSKQAKANGPHHATVKGQKPQGNFISGPEQPASTVESSTQLRDGQKSQARAAEQHSKMTLRRPSDTMYRDRSRQPKFDHIGLDSTDSRHGLDAQTGLRSGGGVSLVSALLKKR